MYYMRTSNSLEKSTIYIETSRKLWNGITDIDTCRSYPVAKYHLSPLTLPPQLKLW